MAMTTDASSQKWFDSNAKQLASWGVDYIKLDYITPGSPANGVNLPGDESREVRMWYNAIKTLRKMITLSISWKLDRSKKYFDIWRANADSMRVDQDIQTYKKTPRVSWENVLRTLKIIWKDISGLTYDQRKSVFIHWIGSSAELNLGDDLTRPDHQGIALLTDPDALSAADFTANYPMQPRNPGSGGNSWKNQNAWISGPSRSGEFIAVLANYDKSGSQTIAAKWSDLGVSGTYECFDVFGKSTRKVDSELRAELKGFQSVMYRCTTRAYT
ncbi:hypothetical protein HRG_001285 [Hirsutella rhossiliensis]|uniref:alpha-galactosidase n=1 Tax=Hirsutella rhossiliensis TaxID=111463 RepID=A0A9P8SMJ0_9HYPO|nr:putative glycoside hydrolase family 27 protein [Hirsutella rhossiliensis]KAH0968643.1 putative glycoside hydrolase family 27 protein [Hirsutella rhossiliensis]